MGVVYRAHDLRLGRVVALKRPRRKLLEKHGFRDRFMSEARTASKVMHPNITTVFEVFEHDGLPWMAMELIDGESLATMLDDRVPIPFDTVLRHAEELCDALRVAHNAGILHLDIKPANILIGGDGHARLTDFGLARVWVEPDPQFPGSNLTTESGSTGRFVGTRGYMSPEQALGKSLDARSDIFSFGLVLYEMCTGRRAFSGSDSSAWLDALLHREPPPIPDLNSEIPEEFQTIIRKAMGKRRFQRYQSANEMLLDLRATRRWISSESGHSPIRRLTQWVRNARRIGLAAAVIAVAIVTTWIIAHSRARPVAASEWIPKKLTRAPGWDAEPALSPDGGLVAFASNASGNPDIWLIDAAGGTPLRLTIHPGSDREPAWYPDGSAIAFTSDRSGADAIWKVPVLGGDPVLVVAKGGDPAISPDGSSIAFSIRNSSGNSRIAITRLDDPGNVRVITGDDDGMLDHEGPAWSPDGRSICYSGFRDLWLVSAEEGSPSRRLTSEQNVDRDPAWSGDGRFIYFSSTKGGTRAIWWISAKGGEAHRFTSGTGPEVGPSLNRDGNRLAYSTIVEELDLMVVDLVSGSRLRMPGSSFQSLPAISPDGSGIAYAIDSGDRYDLWFQALSEDGPGPRRRLTDHPATVATPTFSPDGKWIAFFGSLNKQRDVWVVPAAGGVPRRFTDDEGADMHPAFSPDGRRLAFASDRGGGRTHIWIAPITDGARSGDARQITTGDRIEMFPTWSPGGGILAYLEGNEIHYDVWVVGLDPESPPRQITHDVDVRYLVWGDDEASLFVSGVWRDGRVELRKVSVEDGRAEALEIPVVFGEEDAFGLFSVTADGRFIGYYEEVFEGDVWMLERR